MNRRQALLGSLFLAVATGLQRFYPVPEKPTIKEDDGPELTPIVGMAYLADGNKWLGPFPVRYFEVELLRSGNGHPESWVVGFDQAAMDNITVVEA